jgi:hypothetical protein
MLLAVIPCQIELRNPAQALAVVRLADDLEELCGFLPVMLPQSLILLVEDVIGGGVRQGDLSQFFLF